MCMYVITNKQCIWSWFFAESGRCCGWHWLTGVQWAALVGGTLSWRSRRAAAPLLLRRQGTVVAIFRLDAVCISSHYDGRQPSLCHGLTAGVYGQQPGVRRCMDQCRNAACRRCWFCICYSKYLPFTCWLYLHFHLTSPQASKGFSCNARYHHRGIELFWTFDIGANWGKAETTSWSAHTCIGYLHTSHTLSWW